LPRLVQKINIKQPEQAQEHPQLLCRGEEIGGGEDAYGLAVNYGSRRIADVVDVDVIVSDHPILRAVGNADAVAALRLRYRSTAAPF